MLKFVQSRPPRARSSSPASSTASLDRASSPRPRDRSYPPFPQLHHPPPHREGEFGGGLCVPRPRQDRSGRSGSPSASKTSTANPAHSADGAVLGWEGGDYDQTYPVAATYPARGDRGRVSYPPHRELPAVRRYPVPDRGRTRHSDWVGGGRVCVGDRERHMRSSQAGRHPGTDRPRQPELFIPGPPFQPGTDRDKPITSSPRDRHVRISPYPVEEIPNAPAKSASFPPQLERERSASPASTGIPPQSILARHHRGSKPRPHTTPPARPRMSKNGWDLSRSQGARHIRERSWGPEDEAQCDARRRALTEPSSNWARPHHVGRGGSRGRGQREVPERGREWGKGPEGGGGGGGGGDPWREKGWRGPKQLLSGSWLPHHGPSRHRVHATTSTFTAAQPPVVHHQPTDPKAASASVCPR
ncbi:hypothetical protein ACOMHN_054829 [Nucella lapillus]